MSVTRRLRRPQPGTGVHGSSISGFKATSWTSSRQTASKSKGCFRAPSGLTDSEESDNGGNESPKYSFMAPSGYTDSSSDGEEVTSRPLAAVRPLRALTPPQMAAADRSALARQQLLEATQRTIGQFDAAVLEIDAEEAQELARVCSAMQRLRAEDAGRAAERAQAAQGQRAEALSRLQDVHRQKARHLKDSVAAVQQVAAEKAAKQAAAEQAAHEAAEKQRREAEQARQREEEHRQREEARKQEEVAAAEQAAAQRAQQEEQQRQAASQAPKESRGSRSALQIAPGAAEDEKMARDAVHTAEAEAKGLLEDEGQRKERRRVDKFITLQVQQISATQQQVRSKAQALNQFLSSMAGPGRAYTLLQLARRMLSYCEAQVALSHPSAFPLAEVAAFVLASHPDYAPILLGRLYEVCVLAVPKVHILYKGRDQAEHLRVMGYQQVEQPGSAKSGRAELGWETTDAYISRMQGYIMFYAALSQSEQRGNPVNLTHAWQYAARLLNHLPATRTTATALEAFLKAAGFQMNHVYGRQFRKVLAHIDTVFLPELEKQGDPEARPVYSRLRTYMHGGEFQREPEMRRMPVSDESTADLAHQENDRWR